jgi:hypothetical protein
VDLVVQFVRNVGRNLLMDGHTTRSVQPDEPLLGSMMGKKVNAGRCHDSPPYAIRALREVVKFFVG